MLFVHANIQSVVWSKCCKFNFWTFRTRAQQSALSLPIMNPLRPRSKYAVVFLMCDLWRSTLKLNSTLSCEPSCWSDQCGCCSQSSFVRFNCVFTLKQWRLCGFLQRGNIFRLYSLLTSTVVGVESNLHQWEMFAAKWLNIKHTFNRHCQAQMAPVKKAYCKIEIVSASQMPIITNQSSNVSILMFFSASPYIQKATGLDFPPVICAQIQQAFLQPWKFSLVQRHCKNSVSSTLVFGKLCHRHVSWSCVPCLVEGVSGRKRLKARLMLCLFLN